MAERTFADIAFENKKRKTRRELFLERLGRIVPWMALEEMVEPLSTLVYKSLTFSTLPAVVRGCRQMQSVDKRHYASP